MRYLTTSILSLLATSAMAQFPPPQPPPMVPHPNPSSSLVLPQGRQFRSHLRRTFTEDRTLRAPINWPVRRWMFLMSITSAAVTTCGSSSETGGAAGLRHQPNPRCTRRGTRKYRSAFPPSGMSPDAADATEPTSDARIDI